MEIDRLFVSILIDGDLIDCGREFSSMNTDRIVGNVFRLNFIGTVQPRVMKKRMDRPEQQADLRTTLSFVA